MTSSGDKEGKARGQMPSLEGQREGRAALSGCCWWGRAGGPAPSPTHRVTLGQATSGAVPCSPRPQDIPVGSQGRGDTRPSCSLSAGTLSLRAGGNFTSKVACVELPTAGQGCWCHLPWGDSEWRVPELAVPAGLALPNASATTHRQHPLSPRRCSPRPRRHVPTPAQDTPSFCPPADAPWAPGRRR